MATTNVSLALYPREVEQLLLAAIPAGIKVLLKGKPGIGKTGLSKAIAAKLNADLVVMHPSVSDPTDFKGMPWIFSRPDGTADASFIPFGELRKLCTQTNRTLVVLIDDIGQATHAVQAALMQLLHGGELNGLKISDKVVFIGATNDTSHKAGVQSIIEPVKSRFDTIVEMVASPEDWRVWAIQNGIHDSIVGFIGFRPELLSAFEPTRELTNSPCPRQWEAVSKWVNSKVIDIRVLAGAVGHGAAAEFVGFYKIWQQLPTIEQILLDPTNAPVPSKPDAQAALAAALTRRCKPQNVDKVFTYAARLGQDFEMCLVRDALRVTPDIQNTSAFTKWAVKNGALLEGDTGIATAA